MNDNTDGVSAMSAELERFEAWWAEHGQYCRAGGGDYEKTFAFRAWEAAQKCERSRWETVGYGVVGSFGHARKKWVEKLDSMLRSNTNSGTPPVA